MRNLPVFEVRRLRRTRDRKVPSPRYSAWRGETEAGQPPGHLDGGGGTAVLAWSFPSEQGAQKRCPGVIVELSSSQFRSGISDPGGRPAVWDVITMDNRLNGTPVRTGVHTVPGRESLLTKISDLQTEIGQLQEAIVSHTVVDHAIGVVITLGGLRTDQGFEVLREVSQHTNIKLRQISEQLVNWVHGEQLPDEIRNALDRALAAARSH